MNNSELRRSTAFAEDSQERELAELVEQITERLQAGDRAGAESLVAARPQWAERLRPMLPALEMLADLGRSSEARGTRAAIRRPGATEITPLAGTLGDYRIVQEIGRGGMGVVYEAEEISLRRRVALKVFPLAAVLDPRQLQRFKNEAMAAAQLKHPNIVSVFSVGCHRNVHYYAMEFIEGRSLQEVLAEQRAVGGESVAGEERESGKRESTAKGPAAGRAEKPTVAAAHGSTVREMPWGDRGRSAARLVLQAAEALEHAHSLGIVHRDIKPGNLMVDQSGKVLITDFGLAQVEANTGLTMSGDVLGTLRYMSPEQAAADWRRVDHRTDIYSLGLTLYELATLQPAFPEGNRRELLARVLQNDPLPPHKLAPGLPRDLETIILKAIAKDPPDRYATAQELADDLRRFCEDRPIFARRATVVEHAAKWMRRNVIGVMLALVILSTLLGGSTIAMALVLREQAQTRQALREVEHERRQAERERQAAQRLSVTLALDRGLMHCENGQIDHGLLWLSRAVELASSEDPHHERVARANLRDWARHATALQRFLAPSLDTAASAIAFSPSGDRVAVADGRRVQVQPVSDADTQHVIRRPADVHALAFGPQGHCLYVGEDNGCISRWDWKSGGIRRLDLQHRQPIVCLDCGPEGETLLVAESQVGIRVWNLADKELVGEVPYAKAGRTFGGKFAGDGQRAVTWTGPRVREWSLPDWTPLAQIPSDGRNATDVAFVPGQRRLLVGRLSQALLHSTAIAIVEREPLQHAGELRTVAVDPTGAFFLTGGQDRTARLWEASTHEPIGQPLEHEGSLLLAAFRHDSSTFLTACDRGGVKLWRRPPGAPAGVRLRHRQPPLEVVFAQRGARVITLSGERWHREQTLRLWELPNGRLLQTRPTRMPVKAWAVSADRQRMALAGGGKLALGSVDDHFADEGTVNCPITKISAVAFDPRGDRLAVSGQDAVRFYELPSLVERQPGLAVSGIVSVLAFDPDGNRLLTAGKRQAAQLWDLSTNELVLKLPTTNAVVEKAQFTPDGREVLLITDLGRILRYDVATGKPLRDALPQHREIRSVRLSPQARFAAAVQGDGSCQLFDVSTSRRLGAQRQHYAIMSCVAFSDDEALLATVLPNHSVHVSAIPQTFPGESRRVDLWTQAITGMRLDDDAPVLLAADEWRAVGSELRKRGGPPVQAE